MLQLDGRVDRVIERIQNATFTGKGDKETVPAMYKECVCEDLPALVTWHAITVC